MAGCSWLAGWACHLVYMSHRALCCSRGVLEHPGEDWGVESGSRQVGRQREVAGGGPGALTVCPPVHFTPHPRCCRRCRLSILWQEIAADFKRFGYFFRDNAGTLQRQSGVFRTNCVDTLDRTNVVQVGGRGVFRR